MHASLRSLLVASPLLVAGCSGHSLKSFEGHVTMHTTMAKGEPHDMVVGTKGDKLRFDMNGPHGEATHAVYDPKSNQVLVFLDSQKKYLNLDFSSPSAAPNTNPSTSSITNVGTKKTIAGYDCIQWSVKDTKGHHSDVCLAQGIAFFDPARVRPGGAQQPESPLAKEFREHKSFPLQSIEYDADGKEVSRMEVTKIEKASLPDTDFAVPSGYTKVDLPGGHAAPPGAP